MFLSSPAQSSHPELYQELFDHPESELLANYFISRYSPVDRGTKEPSWIAISLFLKHGNYNIPEFFGGSYDALAQFCKSRLALKTQDVIPVVSMDSKLNIEREFVKNSSSYAQDILDSIQIFNSRSPEITGHSLSIRQREGIVVEDIFISPYPGESTCLGSNGEAPFITPGNSFGFLDGDLVANMKLENFQSIQNRSKSLSY